LKHEGCVTFITFSPDETNGAIEGQENCSATTSCDIPEEKGLNSGLHLPTSMATGNL